MATPLTHNPSNGVTAAVWREGDMVHKVLTCRRPAPAHWAASRAPRHWNFWRREALVYGSALPARLGLGAPRLLGLVERDDGDVELRLEAVAGRHGAELGVEDLAAAAHALGRAQGGREVALLDWAFTGDGALGEDVGNLVPDSVFDLLLPHELLDVLDARATRAYVDGLRGAGWEGDERVVRLGICAAAVKYDWLAVFCLAHAAAAEQLDYGRGATVDAHARYAARAAGLALCVRWAEEAVALAEELGR